MASKGLKETYSESPQVIPISPKKQAIKGVTLTPEQSPIVSDNNAPQTKQTFTPKYTAINNSLNNILSTPSKKDNTPINMNTAATTSEADYMPSYSASPVQLQWQPSSAFGALPVVTGGEFLYPQRLMDIRRDNMIAAAQQKKEASQNAIQKIVANYAPVDAKEVYQKQADGMVDGVLGMLGDVIDKYGTDNAITILTDATNPITMKINDAYSHAKTYAAATKLGDIAQQNAKTAIDKGEVYSNDYIQQLAKYNAGLMDENTLINWGAYTPTYDTLNTIGKGTDIQNKIKDTVNSYVQKGLIGADGKPVDVNGNWIETVKEKSSNDPQLVADLMTAFAYSGKLTPDAYTPDTNGETPLYKYVKSIIPDYVDIAVQQGAKDNNFNINTGEGVKTVSVNPVASFTVNSTEKGKQKTYTYNKSWQLSQVKGLQDSQIISTPNNLSVIDLSTNNPPKAESWNTGANINVKPVALVEMYTAGEKTPDGSVKYYAKPSKGMTPVLFVQSQVSKDGKTWVDDLLPYDEQWKSIFANNGVTFTDSQKLN